ncbi:MAG: EVE domain-containing protein [Candidatus Caenarcaniphilales bacterium]|nr:EVE domain-containing protein [Candidatus Caenarcaniphilales bacterium]
MSNNNYWLMKTEPGTFSIFDLETSPEKTTHWEGVRNYQARNFMRDGMKLGDKLFIYHSVIDPVGIFGTAYISKEAYVDHFQFDPNSKYYDPKASPQKPIWQMVNVTLEKIFKEPITLKQLKDFPELSEMVVVQKGSRLSIQPVKEEEWKFIMGKVEE